MQRRSLPQQQQQVQPGRIFTASEVAEYEYCPLVWWYEQYEPLASADNEELFARLVELEYEHGAQAPALPEYQVAEQLLVRRGAFAEGQQQHLEHAQEVADMIDEAKIEEERVPALSSQGKARRLMTIALTIVIIALVLIVLSFLLSGH